MRVLVLGGTGAMGEPLVKLLSERGYEVYVTSRRRRESNGNIHFIEGDAHNLSFIQQELSKNYDVIVDFMFYTTSDFKKRSNLYLKSTGQYMFLSSARVYADSNKPITENTPRLLDVCRDADYLKTDEYALAKARSENILLDFDRKNWTIIRPYITYNTRRLQLGGLELGTWLTAALSGRSLVLPKDIGTRETTLTYGDDVARAMVALIGNSEALGEAFHITGSDHTKWSDIAEVYRDVMEEFTGHRPELYTPDTSASLSTIMGNTAQIKYDRMYDRVFDNSKLARVCRENLSFMSINEGIRHCFKNYLCLPENQKANNNNVKYMAWFDKSTGRAPTLKELDNNNDKLKYLGYYYIPGVMNKLKKIR